MLPGMMTILLIFLAPTHGHKCPTGFEAHGESCYAFGEGPSSKTAASELCEHFGGVLACPTTQEEIDFLSQRAKIDGRDYWIGLSDQLHEGQWMWPGLCALKQEAGFSRKYPWCPGEPNNGGGGGSSSGDCVRIVGTSGGATSHCSPGGWADYSCAATEGDHGVVGEAGNGFGFICEINRAKAATPESIPAHTNSRSAHSRRPRSVRVVSLPVWPPLPPLPEALESRPLLT